MQTEQIIDVFTVVRLLRAIRPQLIEQVFSPLSLSRISNEDIFFFRINMKTYFYYCVTTLSDIRQRYLPNVLERILHI